MIDPGEIGRALLTGASDAVVASDGDGKIVFWNPAAERIFGFSADEAVGQSLDLIIPEPYRARHWAGYDETIRTGQSRYGSGDILAVPGLKKDGSRNSIEFTITLIKDAEGHVTAMAAVIRDVTKRFEETRALKGELAQLRKRTAEG